MTDPHVARLHAEGRAVLVQPYVAEVDSAGETGIVFVGDEWTHAFRKGPILTAGGGVVEGWYREEHITARTPTDAEFAVAESALDALGSVLPGASRADLLYARVDLVPSPDGPMVMEVELVEPSLFVTRAVNPGEVADRVAAAFTAATGGGGR